MQATKLSDSAGKYQDAAGNRFAVRCCGHILLPPGSAVVIYQTDSLASFLAAQALTTAPITPQKTFAAAAAAGYTVPGFSPALVLDLSEGAQARFTGLLLLITANLTADPTLGTKTQVIFDCFGAPRTLNYTQLQSILLGYGNYAADLLNALHNSP